MRALRVTTRAFANRPMPIEGIKNISQLAQAFASERTPGNDQATAEALAYRLAILVSVKPIGSHPPACRAGAEGEAMKVHHLTRRRWTSGEEQKLDDLLDAGEIVAEIAVILNRSPQAVYALLQRRYRKQARLSTLIGLKTKK